MKKCPECGKDIKWYNREYSDVKSACVCKECYKRLESKKTKINEKLSEKQFEEKEQDIDNSEHKKLLLEQIKEKDIIDEEMGNNGYVALTNDTVYFVFMGVSTGFFFGKKVKTFPIDKITSVDIGKKILASYIELTAAGMGGSTFVGASYGALNENRLFFPNSKLRRFQEIAEKIRSLMKKSKNPVSNDSSADEIEKLHNLMKKEIITQKEFEQKKKKLLES